MSRRRVSAVLVNGALLLLATLTALPLLWMISASLMPAGEAMSLPARLLPSHPTMRSYPATPVAVVAKSPLLYCPR